MLSHGPGRASARRGERSSARARLPVVASLLVAVLSACQDGHPPVSHFDPSRVSQGASVPEVDAASDAPKSMGPFQVTFYYVAAEEEVDAAQGSAKQGGDKTYASQVLDLVVLYDGKTCEPIAEVSRAFAAAAEMQGTGKLKDGRIINIWGSCPCGRSPCFQFTGQKWGKSGNGRGLTPFRTVAADPKVVPLGSLLYIPVLEGRRMPGRAPWGGFVHDGCVVADDTGGAIRDNQLDFFVGRRAYYRALANRGSHAWARSTEVFDGSSICTREGREIRRTDSAI